MNDVPELSSRSLFVIGFFFELGLVLVAALLGWIFLESPFPFNMTYDGAAVVWSLLATVPWALAAVFLTSSAGRRIVFVGRIYERVKSLLGSAIRDMKLDEIVLLSAAAGIGEEVLFRGVLQPLLSIWVASIIFGLLHCLTPAYFVLAFLISLYLGWLQLETQNLVVPIAVHWLYDTVALLLTRRQLRRDAAAAAETEPL